MKGRAFGYSFLLAISSPLILFLSFPNPLVETGIPFLATVGLVPLFILLLKDDPLRFFWVVFSGVLTYCALHFWLYTFNGLALLFVCVVMAFAYLALAGYATVARKLLGERAYLAVALGFVVFEWLKTVGFLAFPYGIVGTTLYCVPGVRLMAAAGGIFILSWLLVFPAALVAAAPLNALGRFLRQERWILCAYALSCLLFLIGGILQNSSLQLQQPQKTLRVLTVQHSGDTWSGGIETYRRNFQILKKLTEQALSENPEVSYDLIIWPETAFVPGIQWHQEFKIDEASRELVAELQNWVQTLPCTFITGNCESVLADPSRPPVIYDSNGEGRLNRLVYNSAVVFNRGKLEGSYRKRHLVPIVEDFPWKEQLPRLTNFLESHGCQLWDKGEESKIFHTQEGVPFAINICYEDVFSDGVREDARGGADFLVNLTNDLWSQSLSAQMQHLALSVFRSIETGLPLVRATNSGMSALILPNGKITAMAAPFRKTTLTAEIPLYEPSSTTNALLLKNTVVFVSIALIFILFSHSLLKQKRRQ